MFAKVSNSEPTLTIRPDTEVNPNNFADQTSWSELRELSIMEFGLNTEEIAVKHL